MSFALLARPCEGWLRLVVSAFLRPALLAKEFLPAWSSRSHDGLPFEFGHDAPPLGYWRWLGALGWRERLSLVHSGDKAVESATGADGTTVRMTWTDCNPIRDGWYWIRNAHVGGGDDRTDPCIVYVHGFEDCKPTVNFPSEGDCRDLFHVNAEWAGPLEPPNELRWRRIIVRTRSNATMPIDESKYTPRPCDDQRFDYHRSTAAGLAQLGPDRAANRELVVRHALQELGHGREFDHILPGIAMPELGEGHSWRQLVFRKPIRLEVSSERVLHKSYKGYDIRSQPCELEQNKQYLRRIEILVPNGTEIWEFLDQETLYPTLRRAHAAGFQHGRRIIHNREKKGSESEVWRLGPP